jgi:rubrerythrin
MPVYQITPANEGTVRNLQTAFESKSNAHAKCLAYAERADFEGLHRAASLLRAIARSEQIHAGNHACVIRKLGGDPEAHSSDVEVNTTLENLTAALENRIYEIDSMYPRFLVENRSAENSAGRTFTRTLEAEKTHARLLTEEIMEIKAGSADTQACNPANFYVRLVCGYVSKTSVPERCWDCNRYCATFETIR